MPPHPPAMPRRRRAPLVRLALLGGVAVPALLLLVMAIGGYFDRQTVRWLDPPKAARHDLVVVYFSGDMGLSVGLGTGTMRALRQRGVAVLAVNCARLFRRARSHAEVDALVAGTVGRALAESGASRVALVGGSFGADVLDTGIAALPARVWQRIAAVVLIVPGTTVYFHANPTGLFYAGAPDSDAVAGVRRLAGLRVTCIYGRDETDSLCRAPVLAGARRIAIPDGHLMLRHYAMLADATAQAVLAPPPPLTFGALR